MEFDIGLFIFIFITTILVVGIFGLLLAHILLNYIKKDKMKNKNSDKTDN